MKRVFIIHNPAASRSSARGLEKAEAVLRAFDCETDLARTEDHGHAVRLAREAAAAGFDTVAVYGGDGTAIQAAEGLLGSPTTLGLIPAGTGNLLSGNLRIPRDPARAAAIIAGGVSRAIDLGKLETGSETRFFAVGCGTGFDADMMAGTSSAQKKRWGMGAYIGFVARTAHRLRTTPVRVTVDGVSQDFDAAMVLVANCAEIVPPVLKLGPDVALNDGFLDIVVLEAHGLTGVALTVTSLVLGRQAKRLRHLRGKRVLVDTATPQVIEADGDLCGLTPFLATVVPRGLRVMIAGPQTRTVAARIESSPFPEVSPD